MKLFGLFRVVNGLGVASQTSIGPPFLTPEDAQVSWAANPAVRSVYERLRQQPRSHLAVLLTATGLVLGLVAMSQWQLQSSQTPAAATSRHIVTQQTIQRLETEQSQLKKEIASLRATTPVDDQGPIPGRDVTDLGATLDQQRAMAGTVPLRGPGIDLLLDDSSSHMLLPSEDPDNYIVHEYQIRDIVNLLWGSGASGISVNGERFVNSTSVYCVGSTILINDTRTSPPYHILAVGDTKQMLAALDDGQALKDLKHRVQSYGLVLKVSKVDTFTLPSFDGSIQMRHTQPDPALSNESGPSSDRPH